MHTVTVVVAKAYHEHQTGEDWAISFHDMYGHTHILLSVPANRTQ